MKNSETLYEDVRTFMTTVVNKVAMAAFVINGNYSAFFVLFTWRTIKDKNKHYEHIIFIY
jgi:hypothetical protein